MKRKDVLNEAGGCSEFVVGHAELHPGEKLPLHSNIQPECNYILSGRAWVRLGKRRVELGPDSGTYFPPGIPHTYEVIGNEPLRFMYTFACEKLGQEIKHTLSDEQTAQEFDIDNMWGTRWAVAEDFEPWLLWEPSKGKRGLTWKSLFDADRGNCDAMIFGPCFIPPGGRYSLHYHDQPEVFYCIGGRGQLFVGGETIDMEPGTAAHVPKRCVHGGQNTFTEPMRLIWIYGTESASSDWSWIPVEDIYLSAR